MVIVSGVSISPGQKSSMRVVTSASVLVSVTNGSLGQDKWWPRGVTLQGLCSDAAKCGKLRVQRNIVPNPCIFMRLSRLRSFQTCSSVFSLLSVT